MVWQNWTEGQCSMCDHQTKIKKERESLNFLPKSLAASNWFGWIKSIDFVVSLFNRIHLQFLQLSIFRTLVSPILPVSRIRMPRTKGRDFFLNESRIEYKKGFELKTGSFRTSVVKFSKILILGFGKRQFYWS